MKFTGFLMCSLLGIISLTSCLRNRPVVSSAACSTFINGGTTYYNSYIECASATQASDCTNGVFLVDGSPQVCFHSPSSSNQVSNSPASLSFLISAINLGAVNSNQTVTFHVKNQGTTAATQCVASLISGSPHFSVTSSSPFILAPMVMTPVSLNANFTPNAGAQTGFFKIECANSVSLLGGSISATYGSGNTTNTGTAQIGLDPATNYSIPSFSESQAPYSHAVTVKNTGAVAANGCSAVMVEAFNSNALYAGGITVISGSSFSLAANAGSHQVTLLANWSSFSRSAKLRVICSGGNSNFVSMPFNFSAGTLSPVLSLVSPNFSVPAIYANQEATPDVTVQNTGPVAATDCTASIVTSSNQSPGPAGVSVTSTLFSIPASNGTQALDVSSSWSSSSKTYKIRISCSNFEYFSGVFTTAPGNPSPYLEFYPSPSLSIPFVSQATGTQTIFVVLKNTGTANGSGCYSYLVDQVGSGTSTSATSFSIPMGATVTRTITINYSPTPRTFKLKANCNQSNWIESGTFTVAGGPVLSANPGFFLENTQLSRDIQITNTGTGPATNCEATIWEYCSGQGVCSNSPELIDLTPPVSSFNLAPNASQTITLERSSPIDDESVYLRIQCSESTFVFGNYDFY